MANHIRFRRGRRAQLPLLSPGEPALCADTDEVFVGTSSGQNLRIETVPDHELVMIQHGLDDYPDVLLLLGEHTAGAGGAGDGPAGGSELVQYPCRQSYPDANTLTVYTIRELARLGNPTLHKVSDRIYTLTFDSTESLYIKLLLNV